MNYQVLFQLCCILYSLSTLFQAFEMTIFFIINHILREIIFRIVNIKIRIGKNEGSLNSYFYDRELKRIVLLYFLHKFNRKRADKLLLDFNWI
jgi:hypothetical protein